MGEKYGRGKSVVPWVMQAVMASTMPKQWNIGHLDHHTVGCGQIHSSPMHLPLLTML